MVRTPVESMKVSSRRSSTTEWPPERTASSTFSSSSGAVARSSSPRGMNETRPSADSTPSSKEGTSVAIGREDSGGVPAGAPPSGGGLVAQAGSQPVDQVVGKIQPDHAGRVFPGRLVDTKRYELGIAGR